MRNGSGQRLSVVLWLFSCFVWGLGAAKPLEAAELSLQNEGNRRNIQVRFADGSTVLLELGVSGIGVIRPPLNAMNQAQPDFLAPATHLPFAAEWFDLKSQDLPESVLYAAEPGQPFIVLGHATSLSLIGPEALRTDIPLPDSMPLTMLREMTFTQTPEGISMLRFAFDGGGEFQLNINNKTLATVELPQVGAQSSPTDGAARTREGEARPNLNPEEYYYRFANGAELRFGRYGNVPRGIRLRRPGSETEEILSGASVLIHPVAEEPRLVSTVEISGEMGVVPVFTSEAILLINSEGKVVRLPTPVMELHFQSQDTPLGPHNEAGWMIFGVKDLEKQFLVISLPYHPEIRYEIRSSPEGAPMRVPVADFSRGETFIYDLESGELMRLAYQAVNPNLGWAPFVRDGILRMPGILRALDLRNLRAETEFFKPRPLVLPTDRNDEPIRNWVAEVDRLFPDVLPEIISGESPTFVPSERERALFNQMRMVLGSRRTNNVVITGDSGVGKTEAARMFFAAVARGVFPDIPRTVSVRVLSESMVDGASLVGMVGNRAALLRTLMSQIPTIVFADEIDLLAGSGRGEGGGSDVLGHFAQEWNSGRMRIVGTADAQRFVQNFGANPSVMSNVQMIPLAQTSKAETMAAIDGWTDLEGLERLPEELKLWLVDVSERLIVTGAQPKKATTVLDRANSLRRILGQAGFSRELIVQAFEQMGIDTSAITQRNAGEYKRRLSEEWNEWMIGQEEARALLIRLEANRMAGMADPERPPIRVLLPGPRGSGKTLLGTTFARITGREFDLIPMASFGNGDLNAFVRRLVVTVLKHPDAVVQLDEFGVETDAVRRIVLSIFNDGVVTLPNVLSGGSNAQDSLRVDFRRVTFILTTNAGEDHVVQEALNPRDHTAAGRIGIQAPTTSEEPAGIRQMREAALRDRALRQALVAAGIPEPILDRVEIAPAPPTTRAQFASVVEMSLKRVLEQARERHGFPFHLLNKQVLLDAIMAAYFNDSVSNRLALRVLEERVVPAIADFILSLEQGTERPHGLGLRFDPDSGKTSAQALNECEVPALN